MKGVNVIVGLALTVCVAFGLLKALPMVLKIKNAYPIVALMVAVFITLLLFFSIRIMASSTSRKRNE